MAKAMQLTELFNGQTRFGERITTGNSRIWRSRRKRYSSLVARHERQLVEFLLWEWSCDPCSCLGASRRAELGPTQTRPKEHSMGQYARW